MGYKAFWEKLKSKECIFSQTCLKIISDLRPHLVLEMHMQKRVGELERGKARVFQEEKKKKKRKKAKKGMETTFVWISMILYGFLWMAMGLYGY